METLPNLRKELQEEYETTKKFLSVYPDNLNDYTPHEKSMKMMALATHVAEIAGWPDFMIHSEKLDFAAGDYQPTILQTKEELLDFLEREYRKSVSALDKIDEETLNERWKMTMGEQILADFSKYEAIRHALNQITHHRAQLGVYYRLNNIPLPPSYGPSADTESF